MTVTPVKTPVWSFDLNLKENPGSSGESTYLPPGMKKVHTYEKQFLMDEYHQGHGQQERGKKISSSASTTDDITLTRKINARKKSKAMEIAMSPGKQIMMNAFMMYMSGKNLNIFSISITSTAVLNPLKSIFNVQSAFKSCESSAMSSSKKNNNKGVSSNVEQVDLQLPKLIYIILNLIWLGVGLYKMKIMRLLPTTSADWSGSVVWKEMLEISSIPSYS